MTTHRAMIVGCGRVGAMVAKALLDQGAHVTILDTDVENFRRLTQVPNLTMVVGDGTSVQQLRRAGIESVDTFVAVAGQDTVNALAAQTAQITFGIRKVVCRVNDPVRCEMYERMGLRPVSPAQTTTNLVLEALER